jgi:chromosome segregation ATPase
MLTFRVFGLFAGFLVAAFLSIALVHNFTQKQEMEQRWNVCENMVQKFVATNRADLKRATDDATHTRTIMGQELQVISNALEENTRKVIENQKLLEQKDQELISKKSIIERLEAESSAANKTNSEMATKLSSLELTVPKMESELKDCKLKTQAPTTAVIPRFYGSHGVDNFVFTKYFQQFGEVKGKYVEINAGYEV